jgi:hypothetical protein
MPTPARRAIVTSRALAALFALTIAGMAGCSPGPTAEQQLDAAFKGKPEDRLNVTKFQGHVTIDGQPPGSNYPLLHIGLIDADKFQDPKKAHRWMAPVDSEGFFSFTTYLKDDGAPVGKYVVIFVDPTPLDENSGDGKRRPRRGGSAPGFGGSKYGKDLLKNLYNDPEQNINKPAAFVIDLQPPGNTNQTFNLEIAGKEGSRIAGQYAVKEIPTTTSFKFSD